MPTRERLNVITGKGECVEGKPHPMNDCDPDQWDDITDFMEHRSRQIDEEFFLNMFIRHTALWLYDCTVDEKNVYNSESGQKK